MKLSAFLAVVTALAWPAAAHAGVASVSGSIVSFVAGVGESNDVLVQTTPAGLHISDNGASVTAGEGCSPLSSAEVLCQVPGEFDIEIGLGDGDDHVTLGGGLVIPFNWHPARIVGGDGNDTLEGAGSNDVLTGGAGDDILRGHLGDDVLDGGPGADRFDGGEGLWDTVTYADRLNPVTVTGDGLANDGENGEADDVLESIEVITGGSANDTILANGLLEGGPGDDTLIGAGGQRGGPGDDTLVGGSSLLGGRGDDTMTGGPEGNWFIGGPGNDTISARANNLRYRQTQVYGEGGDDRIIGSLFADLLTGGSGNDTLSGLSGWDKLSGDNGADLLYGGAYPDWVWGGAGRDRIYGGGGGDRLYGEGGRSAIGGAAGGDLIVGGRGRDLLNGEGGNDVLRSRDRARDRVVGGAGHDRALVDRRLDRVESVEVRS